jgi:hypothetical protein
MLEKFFRFWKFSKLGALSVVVLTLSILRFLFDVDDTLEEQRRLELIPSSNKALRPFYSNLLLFLYIWAIKVYLKLKHNNVLGKSIWLLGSNGPIKTLLCERAVWSPENVFLDHSHGFLRNPRII